MSSKSRKLLIAIPILSFSWVYSVGQIFTNRVEAGVNAGVFIYQGDLTPEPLGAYATLKPQFGIYGAYLLSRSFSIRGNFSFGALKADDSKYSTPAYRQQRNFRFTTPVSEFSGMLVWDILRKNGAENRSGFAPYLFAGAGLTLLSVQRDWSRFNSEFFVNETVEARLAEDAAHRTPRLLPVFPVGGGIKYYIIPAIAIQAETNYRLMQSDYLDGFSKAANASKKDNYYSYSIGLVFSLGYKNRYDCPPPKPM